jgi:crotonobetainyl-CoA:carnitine CoA-transferase CaiB-like acyl-CoA transferase
MPDIFADPHFRARGMLSETPHDELGTVTLASPVPKLSDTPGEIRHAGRGIGHDTVEVLRTLAGLDPTRIEQLAQQGIVRIAREGTT